MSSKLKVILGIEVNVYCTKLPSKLVPITVVWVDTKVKIEKSEQVLSTLELAWIC